MSDLDHSKSATTKKDASKPRRRFVGSKTSSVNAPTSSASLVLRNQIPLDILEDSELNTVINQVLPKNYSFEIHKTIWHVRKNESKMVALQMPEGLQMFACAIADIIERFTPALTAVLGDVTYGACCIDDYTAVALGCDMLVHYGHSCLVPSNFTLPGLRTLYVFVEIGIDSIHVHETIRANMSSEREVFKNSLEGLGMGEKGQKEIKAGQKIPVAGPGLKIELEPGKRSQIESGADAASDTDKIANANLTRLALVSTIQFVAALQRLKEDLSVSYASPSESIIPLWTGPYSPTIPRSKPLSPGEILGCTAPKLGEEVDAIVYLGDGRFHLEAIMIANPTVPAFRYDPYSKKLTRERYDHREMREVRRDAVVEGRKSIGWIEQAAQTQKVTPQVAEKKKSTVDFADEPDDSTPLWGVILGTLGRQGSFRHLQAITNQLCQSRTPIPYMPILLSELSPAKLALFNTRSTSKSEPQFPQISTFIQTSCPRLSIDWGYAFERPLLSPYECAVVLGTGKEMEWMETISEDVQKIGSDSEIHYPMDFYAAGSPWASSRVSGVFA
ncbi:hypothetical protein D9757_000229 [Collybiopsis confluens]|uniref:2-(3-amino-3-carboxypropyl)histidine synthase subunit 1 n=1 Tax=Collybiopsis confluens TaxID=2823264 RepID=A0A8H5I2X5_9AGAR|nr:hypothetical protein D9757_000229 [Collybiopsis confluens]